jgi:hypothetical protein
MSNYKVIKKTTEGTEKHGVFVTNTVFLRVTPRTPWLFFFGIIRFFSLDSLLVILRDETIKKTTDQGARETEKEERKLIRKKAIGKYYRKGWVAGIVWVAGFMTRKGRSDIAKAIMNEAYLDREQCREAGLSDFDLQGIKSIFGNR